MVQETGMPDIQIDRAGLYREDIFTDRKAGTIRRLVPVTSDGNTDSCASGTLLRPDATAHPDWACCRWDSRSRPVRWRMRSASSQRRSKRLSSRRSKKRANIGAKQHRESWFRTSLAVCPVAGAIPGGGKIKL
jgi:hypothetical protein